MTELCQPWASVDKAVSRRHTSAMDEMPRGPTLEVGTFRYQVENLYDLELHTVYEAGRVICDRLTVTRRPGGPSVTTEGLRKIPIAGLVRDGLESTRLPFREYVFAAEQTAPVDRRPTAGPTEEDLRAVADSYRAAYATGAPPTRAVMSRLKLPRSTASRWIALARKRGLLGPATPRKAGG